MKKTVFKWIGSTVAAVAISFTAISPASAQTVDEAFARELKLVEGLKVYNDQLAKQLQAQQAARGDILASIEDSKNLEPQIVPLMNKMLSALESFIRADLPFHLSDRLESIGALQGLMVDAAASTSDRFRNIMDIYAVELEYGNTTEAYEATQDIGGVETPVDMLRVGRLALYSQTRDQSTSYMWDRASKAWMELPAGTNRNIRTAIRVAAKTVAPELLSLPISAPEGV
ncbi:MAG: DUF3450 domain-containing protein [Acidiferrobacterales bacterium]|nr:DUF3450 domain-containing protein [Acidiferrobacterales bacterium]